MEKKKSQKLIEKVKLLLKKKGQKSFEIAKNTIFQEEIIYKPINEALRYFMEEIWYDVHHPALLSLTCEAVDGSPNITTQIGAAMVLLAGAVDIHDDIIDKSEIKGSKTTLIGKFGDDIALLVGDALLFRGLGLLYEACERLPKKQRETVLNLIKQAFFEIGSAEAKEISFKGKYDLSPEEYYKIIEMKAAVSEANARIGAILGGGTPREIDILGCYGKTMGILMTIRDEFIDLFEPDELKNRVANECLPLPMLYAFKNEKAKSKIVSLLEKNLTENDAYKIAEIVMETEEVKELKREMKTSIANTIEKISFIRKRDVFHELELLLSFTIQGL